MNKFLRGKIYKIISPKNPDLIYIGSTCSELHRRFNEHKNSYKNYVRTGKKYISCFKVIDFDDVEISLVENYPCENKRQLHQREAHYIKTINCVNKIIPCRTNREWREDNRERVLQHDKDRYKNNPARKAIVKARALLRYYRNKKDKIRCEKCGGNFDQRYLPKHILTKKHTAA